MLGVRREQHKQAEMLQQRMTAAYAAFAIVLLIALFAWHRYRHPSPGVTDSDAVIEMRLRAKRAVESAEHDFEIALDYSPESVEDVETILARIHHQHVEQPYEETRLAKEALKWGGYVGEVIKTQRECEWALDSEVGGAGSLPIVYDDRGESFPVRWCYKRIVNGSEDNVWHKFVILVLDRDTLDTPPSATHESNAEDRRED